MTNFKGGEEGEGEEIESEEKVGMMQKKYNGMKNDCEFGWMVWCIYRSQVRKQKK